MQDTSDITIEFHDNPALLGVLANSAANRLAILGFEQYQKKRTSPLFPPQRPILAVCVEPIAAKQLVFDMVNLEKKVAHQKALSQYEKNKHQLDILNLYPADLAGYGAYLIDHHPHVLEFFGQRRAFPIHEESRRLHTYVTGGSGSGKSEFLKSLVWHYLTKDTSSALVFIDPHNDVAQQVAKFWPNRDSGRLAYIEPGMDDKLFPGLNPFDIDGKEMLSDMEAEAIADEFIRAFQEVLGGNLTDQMETLLKNTIPVLVKMPDTSVYDLIKFLRPKQKDTKNQQPIAPIIDPIAAIHSKYAALKYLFFAKAHFKNVEMLDFLFGQFDDDPSYVATRNSLTTRLMGIFGGTLMQALFKGKRTVRFEDLISQKKLVVFNLAGLGRETGTIGRFVLITLKIFALNQAKVAERLRTPCHVFVDECQKFVTESMADILQEARKFYVFLTLAQQSAGAKMSSSIFEAVRTNTASKVAGVNSGDSLSIMSKEMGIPAETLAGFKKGQFALFQREAPQKLAVIRMPQNTLKNKAGMKAADWNTLLKEQLRLYYRQPDAREILQEDLIDLPSADDPLNAYIKDLLN